MFEVLYCPDPACGHEGKLKKGEHCPLCGTVAQEFGFKDAVELGNQKKLRKKIGEGSLKFLYSDEQSDEDLRKAIYQGMLNLAGHEAGSSWMKWGAILSGSSADQITAAGFKALIEENKILIRQQELMLRALRKLADAT